MTPDTNNEVSPGGEDGALPAPQDRAVAASPSSPSVSPVPASIPSANGPELWRAILARMPVGSVIAGGAVRDYLLGVEPKDIDVFIDMTAELPMPTENSGAAISAGDARFGLDYIDNEHERFEEYAAVSDIVCVSSGKLFERRVDAVVMENYAGGAALVAGFDFAINRCWFDADADMIHDTPEAKRDRETRTITLLSDEREQRSRERFERLNERWGGGWTYARDAQAIEARRAETQSGSVHESAVGNADAPECAQSDPRP